MTMTPNISYAGMMPEELPRALSNEQVVAGIELFCHNGSQSVRVTSGGNISLMGCIGKVIFYVLNFFGITTGSRSENVQYQFIKLLHLAKSRDLIKGDVEKRLSEAQIKGLLVGVSDAIESRHDIHELRNSLFKFTRNHKVQPGILNRYIVRQMPSSLYTHRDDFGISYLQYADSFCCSCGFLAEPEIQQALSCVDETHLPSDAFCMKFVQTMRNQKDAFKEIELTKEEKVKIDLVLKKALRALARNLRFSEAIATIEILRPRLLKEKEPTPSENIQLGLLYQFLGNEEYSDYFEKVVGNIDVLTENTLDPEEFAAYCIYLLNSTKEKSIDKECTPELLKKNHLHEILEQKLPLLIKYHPKDTAHALASLYHNLPRDQIPSPDILISAMSIYSSQSGIKNRSSRINMMGNIAHYYVTKCMEGTIPEYLDKLDWTPEVKQIIARARVDWGEYETAKIYDPTVEIPTAV